MNFKGFRVFALIYAIVGFLGTVLFSVVSIMVKQNPEPLISALGEGNVKTILAYSSTSMLTMIGLFVLNLTSFILVTIGVHKDKMRRWYFLPGLLGAFISIGTVVGIVYFIITIVAFFKVRSENYEGREAHRHMITLAVIFLVAGLAGCILPFVIEFDPAYMSLMMFVGMCGVCFASTIGTYIVCSPDSRLHVLIKLAVTLVSIAVVVGLYFLFKVILKDNVSKFDGDWPTIRTAIITACSVAGLMDFSYFIFSLRHRSYEAYIDMQQISLGIAIVGLILANFLVLYWWLIIEAILWIWSFTFIAFVIGGFAMAGGGGMPLGHEVFVKDKNGKEIKAKFQGNGVFKGEDGSLWRETGEGTGEVRKEK